MVNNFYWTKSFHFAYELKLLVEASNHTLQAPKSSNIVILVYQQAMHWCAVIEICTRMPIPMNECLSCWVCVQSGYFQP